MTAEGVFSPAIRRKRRSTIVRAPSWIFWRTVVNGGLVWAARAMSSYPTTAMSPGTDLPASAIARMALAAMISVAAKMASQVCLPVMSDVTAA